MRAMSGVISRDAEIAKKWAYFYKLRGWQPLPSRPDAKRPFTRYSQWWDEPAPEDLFERFPSPSLQLMTGRRWRLLVIDLDGDEARERFRAMAPVPPPRKATPPAPRPPAPVVVEHRGRYRAAEVLAAIPDPVGLATSWGLRVASRRPNAAGWVSCHALGREDRNPSASISAETGRYWDPDRPRTISLFELGAELGVYLDWRDAVADLGRRFGAREMTS
jgi:hypothetical protein